MENDFINKKRLPKVSFILPTRNAAGIINNCLQSIQKQDYPQEQFEIVIVDGHSTDKTREIAANYKAIVLEETGSDMEEAKQLALEHATGDFIVFIDADNEITHSDYIRLAVTALQDNSDALGVEGYYPPSKRMSSFCAYLTHLLHISDPVCWLMSVKPILIEKEGDIEHWMLPPGRNAYPLGANGFVYRKSDLDQVAANQKFSDTHIALYLIEAGKRKWLRIKDRGVHHYYVSGLMDFLQKRRRSTCHFFNTRRRFNFTWTAQKPRVPGWLACLYGITVIGPLYHTFTGLLSSKDWRWLWHPIGSFLSSLGVVWGIQTYIFRGKEKNLVASLQPRQSIKDISASR